jgi:tetratricopeptide (TPR) repeat protein
MIVLSAKLQSVESLIQKGIDLEKKLNETQAYKTYQEVLSKQPLHLFALVRCSELASRIGKLQHSEQIQEKYYKDALGYALKAIKVKPDDSEANLVLSVAYGRLALLKSGGEKVEYVKEIKAYAEKALRLNRSNFKALHVLGKWHYEVSDLNMIELAAVRLFYGGLPVASLDSSILFYEKAKTLAPGFALNYLELAKAKKRKGDKKAAVQLLKVIFTLPPSSSEDGFIRSEANRLLRSWGN